MRMNGKGLFVAAALFAVAMFFIDGVGERAGAAVMSRLVGHIGSSVGQTLVLFNPGLARSADEVSAQRVLAEEDCGEINALIAERWWPEETQ